jgi:hypothetical protein
MYRPSKPGSCDNFSIYHIIELWDLHLANLMSYDPFIFFTVGHLIHI